MRPCGCINILPPSLIPIFLLSPFPRNNKPWKPPHCPDKGWWAGEVHVHRTQSNPIKVQGSQWFSPQYRLVQTIVVTLTVPGHGKSVTVSWNLLAHSPLDLWRTMPPRKRWPCCRPRSWWERGWHRTHGGRPHPLPQLLKNWKRLNVLNCASPLQNRQVEDPTGKGG